MKGDTIPSLRLVNREKHMKKIIALILSGILCLSLMGSLIHAEDLNTILGEENKTQDEKKADEEENKVDNEEKKDNKTDPGDISGMFNSEGYYTGDDYTDKLIGANDMNQEVAGVNLVIDGIKLVTSALVQVLSYIAISLLTLRVILDLLYIGLPFLRGFLANGYTGVAPNPAGGQAGMGMNPMGGMGMNSMGMGGYNRYGGMNQGYGGMPGMSGMGGMNNQMGMQNNQRNGVLGSIQWVSNAALNAVASESTLDPNGSNRGPLKTYVKDMLIILVCVPFLVILAMSGQLANFGMLVGSLVARLIAQLAGSI